MSKSREISKEEKLAIVKRCLSGELGVCEASRQMGVTQESIRRWIYRYQAEGEEGLKEAQEQRKYPKELKEAAVKDYLSGKGSMEEICKKYKIRSTHPLRNWIKVYNGHKEFRNTTGGSRMTKARKTTFEERVAIARECIVSGRNYGDLAIKYNVSYQQVYIWTNKYAEQGEAGLEDRRGKRTAQQQPRTPEEEMKIRIAQLEHELYMTKMERDLLKKLDEIERRRG